jgi:chromate transporter
MTSDRTPLLHLGWTFLRIGAVAFGGLGAMVAMIDSELVQRQRIATREQITESLTYTKLLPGSTVVQIVAYLGWRLGGWGGAAVSTIVFLLPSFVLMVALAYGYSHLAAVPATVAVRRGVLAGVVGLLLLTMHRLAKPVLATPFSIALAVGAFAVTALAGIGVVWVVVAAGLIGVAAGRR